ESRRAHQQNQALAPVLRGWRFSFRAMRSTALLLRRAAGSGLTVPLQGPRRTDQRRMRRADHPGRDRGEIAAETALALEARAEARAHEEVPQLGHDAATDVDAAARAEGEGEIGGHGAEHRAEAP